MTINIISKGVSAYKPVFQAACMECWTTFTYEQEDVKQDNIYYYYKSQCDIVFCPVCKAKISVERRIPYVKT